MPPIIDITEDDSHILTDWGEALELHRWSDGSEPPAVPFTGVFDEVNGEDSEFMCGVTAKPAGIEEVKKGDFIKRVSNGKFYLISDVDKQNMYFIKGVFTERNIMGDV